jgi:hypothetical protein
MLIASKNGDITAADLVSETDKVWLLDIPLEKRQVRISKTDTHQRPFNDMVDALTWAGAEPELIEHFANQKKVKVDEQ